MKFLSILVLFLAHNTGYTAGYDTLPIGINTFVFKQVITNKIESKFDANSSNKTLIINQAFTTSNLSTINGAIQSYFDELKNLSPDAYNTFSLGEFEAKAWAQVNAQGIGFGHGISNHLTMYGSLPIYHFKTTVNFYQTKSNNLAQIKNTVLNTSPTTAIGTFVKQLTLQLPDSNEELLQSVLVNFYKYKPLGTWEKDSLGDAEVGFIYRLTDNNSSGLSVSSGIVLPTGTPDDPDSLQDISSGDGQIDLFLESNAGVSFLNNKFSFDLKARFTYQIESTKKMRLYTDSNTPLSENSAYVKEKLGNKIDTAAALTYNPSSWLNFNASYLISTVGKSQYEAESSAIKNALAYGTETKNEWIKIGTGFSTVEMYKKSKFEIPFEINLSAQTLISAKNSADYNRYDLDFKFYF